MSRLLTCGWETGLIDEDGGASYKSQGNVELSTSTKRSGSYSLGLDAWNNGTGRRTIPLGASLSELFIRLSLFYSDSKNLLSPFIELLDSAGVCQMYLAVNTSTNLITAYLGEPFTVTLIGTASASALASGHNAIEIRAKIHDTTGVLQVKLNGDLVIDYVGDTLATANANVASIALENRYTGDPGAEIWHYIDDLAVNDTGGAAQNSWCGDAAVLYLPGNADGNSEGQGTAWDGSDGNTTDNWALTDEIPPATADYVASSDVNDIDSYNCADVPAGYNSVVLAQPVAYAALGAAGEGDIRLGARDSGTDYPDAADKPLTAAYKFIKGDVIYTAPSGGALTLAKTNALEVLVKVT